jgi:hypothetical protein
MWKVWKLKKVWVFSTGRGPFSFEGALCRTGVSYGGTLGTSKNLGVFFMGRGYFGGKFWFSHRRACYDGVVWDLDEKRHVMHRYDRRYVGGLHWRATALRFPLFLAFSSLFQFFLASSTFFRSSQFFLALSPFSSIFQLFLFFFELFPPFLLSLAFFRFYQVYPTFSHSSVFSSFLPGFPKLFQPFNASVYLFFPRFFHIFPAFSTLLGLIQPFLTSFSQDATDLLSIYNLF